MDIVKQSKSITKFLLPAVYLAVMVLVVLNVWKEQSIVRKGGGGPLYRSLMECPAYIRRGFDPASILTVPEPHEEWARFESPPFRISNSSLPDLPKRPFLSPLGREAEEFTILIAVEFDNRAIEFLNSSISISPGIFLGYIGENWEIYFNGEMIAAEMHLDEAGQIKSRRNWRDVSFQLDKSLIAAGTNILSLRILGDPAYDVSGLYYTAPYYLDDYRIIEKRQQNYLLIILCSISGFLGIYFLFLFLSVRRRREIIYLYYGIFSVLFCAYSIARNGIVNALIPNSDISIRMEYFALFLMVTVLCFFTEKIGKGKITLISKAYMGFCVFIALSQMFFCTQYGDDVLKIWNVTILIYFSYVFFYDVIYFFFGRQSRSGNLETTMIHIMYGAGLMYACGIFDVLDVLFFHKSFSLFIYSTFVVHLGLAVTLLWRFNDMYKQMEQSNVILEETVKERTQELQKASRAKSDFLAVMSHEIRTPLNAVIGLSQIELQENTGSNRENIAQIHRSGSYLLGIINDILDISKIESGNFELVPVEYDSGFLIGDTINLNKVRIGSKPLKFILEINGDFPRKLIGDELRVKQILNNLLSNAVKYTHKGTITLSVECDDLESSSKLLTTNHTNSNLRFAHEQKEIIEQQVRVVGGKNVLIRFTVRDTGIGIRSEDMEKLFDNYTQLDSRSNRKTEGTGLGLPIARDLARMMGGAITVESKYGAGSVFTVELLQGVKKGELHYDTIGEETAESLRNFSYVSEWQEDTARSHIPHGTVMVVDDIPANLMVARGLLSSYGLNVDTAGSGREAIERIKTHNYDLIFVDHMMPEMDGVETAAAIRALEKEEQEKKSVSFTEGETQRHLRKQMPIIALTANALRGMREYYLEHGFDDYLSKPINAKELDEILVKWIKPNGKEDKIDNFSYAVESQRLDKLNHYRASFEIGKEFDTAYFERFTALVRIFDAEKNASLLAMQAALIEAGQKEDAQKIKEILPAFCEAVFQEASLLQAMNNEQNDKRMNDILSRLKKAIKDGSPSAEGETAETILGEMGQVKLTPAGRELYFALYDLLVRNNTEKALEEINNFFGEADND